MQMRSYQEDAKAFIVDKKRCAVFLGMGRGKTLVSLTAISHLLGSLDIDDCLIIAPKLVAEREVWDKEQDKFKLPGIRLNVIKGNLLKRLKCLESKNTVHIVGIQNLKTINRTYDMIVIDESTFVRNFQTERWKLCKDLCEFAKYVVLLSGTPSPKGVTDLWAQIYLIDKGQRLGKNISHFRKQYMVQGYMKWDWKLKEGAEDKIRDKVSDIVFALDDEKDTCGLVENDIEYDMNEHDRFIYEQMQQDYIVRIKKEEIVASTAAIQSNKLIQITSGILYSDNPLYISEQRLDLLQETIESINSNTIIGYWYRTDSDRIKRRFGKRAISIKDKNAIERWNDGDIELLMMNPQSAAHGLNLQFGGCDLIFYTLCWSLELYLQLIYRLRRPGQAANDVRVHRLIARDTIDERVARVLKERGELQQSLMDYWRNLR